MDELNLSWCYDFTEKHVQVAVTHVLETITHLNLSRYQKNLQRSDVCTLVGRCPNLVHIDLSNSVMLKNDCFPEFYQLNYLQHLSFSWCYDIIHWRPRGKKPLPRCGWSAAVLRGVCFLLFTIIYGSTHGPVELRDRCIYLHSLLSHCSKLLNLSLEGLRLLDPVLDNLALNTDLLRLNLSGVAFAHVLEPITQLNLSECRKNPQRSDVSTLVGRCPNLVHLDFSDSVVNCSHFATIAGLTTGNKKNQETRGIKCRLSLEKPSCLRSLYCKMVSSLSFEQG
ncbi:hypothetical protein Celaphus_00016245, partial [Cervus elaphus hippelaphus]